MQGEGARAAPLLPADRGTYPPVCVGRLHPVDDPLEALRLLDGERDAEVGRARPAECGRLQVPVDADVHNLDGGPWRLIAVRRLHSDLQHATHLTTFAFLAPFYRFIVDSCYQEKCIDPISILSNHHGGTATPRLAKTIAIDVQCA